MVLDLILLEVVMLLRSVDLVVEEMVSITMVLGQISKVGEMVDLVLSSLYMMHKCVKME